MKKVLVFIFLFLITYLLSPVYAIESPYSVPNNKVGVHILFPQELDEAANLVNSSGGEWGYVTIPIQAGDRDLSKWQSFMDKARKLHIIPILRLATEGDYFNTTVWRKPTEDDIVDFANFLNSLQWPVKNRYIIVFNEPNRNAEWGGQASPGEYASILKYAQEAFKQRSQDFFIISAGLDNAAASDSGYNEFIFLESMQLSVPDVFKSIDGMGSHSYPNPGFVKSPLVTNSESINSFTFEQQLLQSYTGIVLPVFITETGWSQDLLSDDTVANYYQIAFSQVWNNPQVIAVTPFLLEADSGPFTKFSLIKNGAKTKEYQAIQSISKIAGKPAISQLVFQSPNVIITQVPVKKFKNNAVLSARSVQLPEGFKLFIKWLLKL